MYRSQDRLYIWWYNAANLAANDAYADFYLLADRFLQWFVNVSLLSDVYDYIDKFG